MRLQFPALMLTLFMTLQPAMGQQAGWQTYTDPDLGFSALLPAESFSPVANAQTPGVTLGSRDGAAQINFYGGPAEGMSRETLEARLASGEQIRTITYRAGGESWFVLSGFYAPAADKEPVIFYTKVMFSAAHDSFSAFEISFPESEKPRYEAMVEIFEDNFTRPQG